MENGRATRPEGQGSGRANLFEIEYLATRAKKVLRSYRQLGEFVSIEDVNQLEEAKDREGLQKFTEDLGPLVQRCLKQAAEEENQGQPSGSKQRKKSLRQITAEATEEADEDRRRAAEAAGEEGEEAGRRQRPERNLRHPTPANRC